MPGIKLSQPRARQTLCLLHYCSGPMLSYLISDFSSYRLPLERVLLRMNSEECDDGIRKEFSFHINL